MRSWRHKRLFGCICWQKCTGHDEYMPFKGKFPDQIYPFQLYNDCKIQHQFHIIITILYIDIYNAL